jgi:PAS domain S-box-containing protein
MRVVVPRPRSGPFGRSVVGGDPPADGPAAGAAGALWPTVAGEPSLGDVRSRTAPGPVDDDEAFALIERNPQPMFVFERATLRIIAASAAASRAYGYDHDELMGMTLRDLIGADQLEAFDEFYRAQGALEAPGPLRRSRRRHRRKDGSEMVVETTSDDLVYRGVPCRILVCEDVAELEQAAADVAHAREQVRATEERYRLLFEHNPQPMAVYDQETLRLVDVNAAMVAQYGYSREELLAMSGLDLLVPEDVAGVRAHLAANPGVTQPGAGPKGWRHHRKDRTIIDVETASDNVTLDGRRCRLVLFHDVTARNRASEELQAARDTAVAASNMKSAFLANMSHEIRTPMNAVIGMTELLLDSQLDSDQHYLAQHVASAGEHLLELINDILDVAKIEAGRLELDAVEFDPHTTLELTCSMLRPEINKRGLTLGLRIEPAVPRSASGDERRLRQVLSNLLANAAKFTSAGAISVTATAPAASTLRIEVADTGIGIDPNVLDAMFKPFTQADASTTRVYGGTGLGLAIAHDLVQLMGGTIGADSEPGHGSTFWIEVPLAPAS